MLNRINIIYHNKVRINMNTCCIFAKKYRA